MPIVVRAITFHEIMHILPVLRRDISLTYNHYIVLVGEGGGHMYSIKVPARSPLLTNFHMGLFQCFLIIVQKLIYVAFTWCITQTM